MEILIAGASGSIGTGLVRRLQSLGSVSGPHRVRRLVRRTAMGPDEVQWDPAAGLLDPRALDAVDAVINLSGAGIAGAPWTRGYKETLYSSRIRPTRTLVTAMKRAASPPRVFLSQSASGFYGDRGSEVLPETAGSGDLLLSDICRKWEDTASGAPAGVRTVVLRTGVVLTPDSGALAALLLPLRLFAGGPLGAGTQWWPWITLEDELRAMEFLLTSEVSGPVNMAAPSGATLAELVTELGRVLHRPTRFRVPARVLTTAMGQLAEELLLTSARLVPAVLQREGFTFNQATVPDFGRWVRRSLG